MKKVLLISVAFFMCSLAHAAPRMLKSECHETEDHIRTCLAPGEAPVTPLSRSPAVVPPTPTPERQSVPEQSVGPPQTSAVLPVQPEPQAPVAQPYYPPPDNRVRQQFRFNFGGVQIITPPIVVGHRNQTCQTQCWNRGGFRDCRQYCW
jgi:hypothetical protein